MMLRRGSAYYPPYVYAWSMHGGWNGLKKIWEKDSNSLLNIDRN
jgi:hypothetical protein